MRGYEKAGVIALRATDGIDHGANGALAVCAGDVNDFGCKGVRRGVRPAFDTNALQFQELQLKTNRNVYSSKIARGESADGSREVDEKFR